MLFNNGMYRKIVHLIQRQHDEQSTKGMSTNNFQNCLLFGACYKLVSITYCVQFSIYFGAHLIQLFYHRFHFDPTKNTPEDFEYALEVWDSCKKEFQLTQSRNFLAMLAIRQEHPQKALEILPSSDEHFSSFNVRLLAHFECDEHIEAIEAIENRYKNKRIFKDVVSCNIKFIRYSSSNSQKDGYFRCN